MKKSLILAALFLSSAARADVYICEATHEATIGVEAQSSVKSGFRLSVDVGKGVRIIGWQNGDSVSGQYIGDCVNDSDVIECSSIESGVSDRTTLRKTDSDIDFIFVRANIYFPIVASFHGKCVVL